MGITPQNVEAWAGFAAALLTDTEHPDKPASKRDREWAFHKFLDKADAYYSTLAVYNANHGGA